MFSMSKEVANCERMTPFAISAKMLIITDFDFKTLIKYLMIYSVI